MVSEEFPAEADDLPAGLAEGSRLANYHLEDRIGAGGMAVVFRARDERLQRLVALKVLAPSLAGDEAFRHRFIRESQAAAAVDDPHIIPVFEAGEVEGVLFLAMRYVPGGDVRALVRRAGPRSPAHALGIISPVAAALDAAHSAGLVHRDVKLANILLDVRPGRPDHVYLSDFGLSKMVMSSLGPTRAGQFLGTPGYSAPEQLEGKPVDGRADQYSLACATFELLCGQMPFPRDHVAAVIWAHMSEAPPPLTSRRPGLPAADGVLARALAKAPADRYESCREFADALRAALGLEPYNSGSGAASHVELTHRPAERLARHTRADLPVLPGASAYVTTADPGPPPAAEPVPRLPAAADPDGLASAASEQVTRRQEAEQAAAQHRGQVERLQQQVREHAAAQEREAVLAVNDHLIALDPVAADPDALASTALEEVTRQREAEQMRIETQQPAAGTAGVPAEQAAAATPFATVTAAPPVAETAPEPDAGPAALTGDGEQRATPQPRDDHPRVASDGPGSGTGEVAPGTADLAAGRVTAAPAGVPTTHDLPPRHAPSVRSRLLRRARLVSLAGILLLLVVAVIVVVLVIPGNGRPSAGHHASGGSTRSAPASPHSALASPKTPAPSFAVRPGPRLTDPGSVGLASISFSPDGKELFTSDGYLWNLSSLTYTRLLGSGTFEQAGFSPSGTTLAAVGPPSAGATVWDAQTHAVAATLNDADNTFALTAAYSSDGTTLAVGADSGKVYVWDVGRQALITTLPLRGQPSVQSLAFSPDGNELAVAEADHTYVWDLASHAVVATLPSTLGPILFSPNGKRLAIGDELFNATTYTSIATLSSASCSGAYGIAFSPGGSDLAVATGTQTCVWDVAEHRLIGAVTDPGGAGATAVAFSRQGGMLATGDDNGSIYLWHVK